MRRDLSDGADGAALDSPRHILERPWMKRALVIGFWTFFGTLIAGESYLNYRVQGDPRPFLKLLVSPLSWAYAWALFTPAVLWLGRRVRFDEGRWPRALTIHLPASLVFAFAGVLVFVGSGQLIGRVAAGPDALLDRSMLLFVRFLHMDPFIYWIILGLGYVAEHYRESRRKELRASQLETQLAEARLSALESQLHPHFLFNALHTIAVLVRTGKNSRAVRVVTDLAELLRRALDRAGAQLVPLKQELEFIERYLEIECIRFGDRLTVDMSIEPATLDARVPHLILQPLVENAVRHGIAARSAAERLEISARRRGDRLQLGVRDDGPGLSGGTTPGASNGVGLSTTRERLQQLYGEDHEFVVHDAEGGGVAAEITIPFQLAPGEREREG